MLSSKRSASGQFHGCSVSFQNYEYWLGTNNSLICNLIRLKCCPSPLGPISRNLRPSASHICSTSSESTFNLAGLKVFSLDSVSLSSILAHTLVINSQWYKGLLSIILLRCLNIGACVFVCCT